MLPLPRPLDNVLCGTLWRPYTIPTLSLSLSVSVCLCLSLFLSPYHPHLSMYSCIYLSIYLSVYVCVYTYNTCVHVHIYIYVCKKNNHISSLKAGGAGTCFSCSFCRIISPMDSPWLVTGPVMGALRRAPMFILYKRATSNDVIYCLANKEFSRCFNIIPT